MTGTLALKLFLPLGALMLAQGAVPLDWVSVIERWGIAGVWALVAYVLWKKQEKTDKIRMKLQQDNQELQSENSERLHELITDQTAAHRETADALKELARKIQD